VTLNNAQIDSPSVVYGKVRQPALLKREAKKLVIFLIVW
jgi:hypothetical protein